MDNTASATNAQILIGAGFPQSCLVPVIPPHGPLFEGGPVTDLSGDQYYEAPANLPPEALGKVPGEMIQGAWIARHGWHTRPMRDEEIVTGGSVGVLCGDDVAGFDLDALDPTLAQALSARLSHYLPHAPYRVGRAPKRLVAVRVVGEEPARKTARRFKRGDDHATIEIIGKGGQFVAAGIHPFTLKPYQWFLSNGLPITPQFDTLPEMTAEQIATIFDDLCALAEAEGWEPDRKSKPRDGAGGTNDLGRADPAVVAAVMRETPNRTNRIDWITIGYALKNEMGDEGLPVWLEWCSRWEGGATDSEQYLTKTYQRFRPSGEATFGTIRDYAKAVGAEFTPETQTAVETEFQARTFAAALAKMPPLTEEQKAAAVLPKPELLIHPASAFEGKPVKRRRELIKTMFPLGQVSMVNGMGATGKSLLMAQLTAAVALGQPWVGIDVAEQGAALFLTAEDDIDEVHRRMRDVANHYGVSMSALSDLHILCLAGKEAVLGKAGSDGVIRPTPLWEALCVEVRRLRPKVVVLDTLADIFAGDENNRSHARQFIGILRGLAIELTASVIILAHPSKSAVQTGDGYSGSTAWDGGVRYRALLEADADVPDVRILHTGKKANYAQGGGELRIIWKDGVFIPVPKQDLTIANTKAVPKFLELLDLFTEQGRIVSCKGGSNYAPTLFADHPDAENVNKRQFKEAMEYLLKCKLIVNEKDWNDSNNKVNMLKRASLTPSLTEA